VTRAARTSRETRADVRGRGVPEATIARLPLYHRALVALDERGATTVSSEELATAAGVNSAKLRKDLSYLGSYGTRGVGYDVSYLVYQIARELGLSQDWPVVIVGVGNLGHALANYGGFASRGFRVVALVDASPDLAGEVVADHRRVGPRRVAGTERARDDVLRHGVHLLAERVAIHRGPRAGEALVGDSAK